MEYSYSYSYVIISTRSPFKSSAVRLSALLSLIHSATSFTLTTEQNGVSVVQKANDLWGWSERFNYPGYGRMVTRAIRGTSLDIFERW